MEEKNVTIVIGIFSATLNGLTKYLVMLNLLDLVPLIFLGYLQQHTFYVDSSMILSSFAKTSESLQSLHNQLE